MLIQRPSGPTAEKFQRSFWEEHLGPKGRLEGIRVYRFSISRSRDIKAITETRNRGLASQSREKGYFSKILFEARRYTTNMKSRNTKNETNYISKYDLRDHLREIRRDETPPGFNLETHLTEMHWPSGAEIPNARFLRKYAIVPKGKLMPKAILVSPGQLSMNEKDAEILQGYWEMSAEDFEDLLEEGEMGKDGNVVPQLFGLYTSSSSRAATPLRNWLPPSIFYDGDLDYQWEPVETFKLQTTNQQSKDLS
jgi:hypothetical protein